ncbi:RrF2 family transcriptional regulator [Adhaeribacter soli]|uniref:Rrf2 family transcriptional regulator n=1 Tax=Adhaeribacter soli TaxID=2607655 RepID=A0A5N1J2U7_9BACT|nr:Rrf2 family transcriptional regulator [Adhaeribacter soli]KAA9340086.1 Rrf2 family transcriptional regulator [Adhaeribacter soli]
MNNLRFATALHILTLLSQQPEELLPSEYLAGSINVNAAVVRKEISNLRNHGFIQSKEGKGGGSMLAKPASEILLSDIYQAVRQAAILGRNNAPNPACPVGKQINAHLEDLYSEAEANLIRSLSKKTLADFARQFS